MITKKKRPSVNVASMRRAGSSCVTSSSNGADGVGMGGLVDWAAMIFVLGRQRAPLLDEVTQLDPARRMLATFTLGLFFLVITPIPMLIY